MILEERLSWHSHKEEDELFYVIKGKLNMEFRDKTKKILQGEMIIVPKGVEHMNPPQITTLTTKDIRRTQAFSITIKMEI